MFLLAPSFDALEKSGVDAQHWTQCLSVRLLGLMVTGKNELTQGGFNERKPGGSQLHQAVLQSVAGGWFANQHRLIFFKGCPTELE